MYSRETLVILQHLLDLGLKKRAIAEQLGVSPRTIHHWIASGQVTRVVDGPNVRRPAPRVQQLDPFKPLIQERLTTYPALSAVRFLAECRAAGYAGGLHAKCASTCARVRPRPAPEPVVRFETAAGQQAQFDFAEFRLPWGKRYALLTVLGYSRYLHVEWVPQTDGVDGHAWRWSGPSPRSGACRANSSSISSKR